MGFFQQLFGFKHQLPPEVVQAYYNRLPSDIAVGWERDGEFIVGKIEANGTEFHTQGTNADEFIEMVNDAVFSMEIPQKDISAMKAYRVYAPPLAEMQKLQDQSIKKATIAIEKVLQEA